MIYGLLHIYLVYKNDLWEDLELSGLQNMILDEDIIDGRLSLVPNK